MNAVQVTASEAGLTAGHSHVPWEMVRELTLCPWKGEVWLEVRTGESTRRRWKVTNTDAELLELQRSIARQDGRPGPSADVPFSWRSTDGHDLVLHTEDVPARRRALALGLFGFALGTSAPLSSAVSVYWWPGHPLFVGMAIYAITALVLGPSIAVVALRQRPLAVAVPVTLGDATVRLGEVELERAAITDVQLNDGELTLRTAKTTHRVSGVQARGQESAWLLERLRESSG